MLEWIKMKHEVIGVCHVARIGEGSLGLRAYIASNGAGWFNWCISPCNDDFMMEHPNRLAGGATTLRQAKTGVEQAAAAFTRSLITSLGLPLPRKR